MIIISQLLNKYRIKIVKFAYTLKTEVYEKDIFYVSNALCITYW